MRYRQKVIIKNSNIQKVIRSFHEIKFIKFLVSFQPVKIIKWNGINNNLIAHLKFWLINWHSFIVIHKKYKKTDTMLSFIDEGLELPIGITYWKHEHIIKEIKNQITIEDRINFKHRYYLVGIILYPILVCPILIRKALYPLYFR